VNRKLQPECFVPERLAVLVEERFDLGEGGVGDLVIFARQARESRCRRPRATDRRRSAGPARRVSLKLKWIC
jgi:hypothetical protein